MDYSLSIDLSKYKISREYYRNKQKCLFDIIRERLIVTTPEEIVRQQFTRFLIEELEVPKCKIGIEVPMAHFKTGAKDRADIVVYGENKEGNNIPVILIECKAPDITLTDRVWFQAFKYDEILGAGFIIITNGYETYGAVWDEEYEEYHYLDELPKYQDLVKNRDFKYKIDESEGWVRPNFKELLLPKNIEEFIEYDWLHKDTNKDLYPLIMNLIGFLFDFRLNYSPFKTDKINIVEDGYRYDEFGNAGGRAWAGDYRYFIVENEDGNNQVISFSILRSYLVVAIDDFDKRHVSLQLNLKKYVSKYGDKYTIWHDGKLTIGKSGAAKVKDVINFIKTKDISLVNDEEKIILGTFDCSKEINWEQNGAKQFTRNLINYVLLRDEFRRIKLNEI